MPCLNYRRAIEEESERIKTNVNQELPNARIETAKDNVKLNNLTPKQLQAYSEKLFQFRNIKIMKFKSWSQRRQFTKKRKHEKQLQRPTLPDGSFIYFNNNLILCFSF